MSGPTLPIVDTIGVTYRLTLTPMGWQLETQKGANNPWIILTAPMLDIEGVLRAMHYQGLHFSIPLIKSL